MIKCQIKKYIVFKDTDREFTGNRKEIAHHFGIKIDAFRGRLKQGYSPEEAIDWDGGKNDTRSKTIFKGTDREFTGNYREIAEHFGINLGVFRGRLQRGYSPEESIDWGGGKKSGSVKYTVFKDTNREFTGSYKEIAEHFEINYKLFKARLYYGYSLEEAIEIPLKRIKEKNLFYKEVNGDLREICRHFNKNYTEVYNKLRYNHTLEWSIESTDKIYTEE